MIFVKNFRGGREVNMINTLSKINLSKIGWEGGGSTSIWIMSVNILRFFLGITPYMNHGGTCVVEHIAPNEFNFMHQIILFVPFSLINFQ